MTAPSRSPASTPSSSYASANGARWRTSARRTPPARGATAEERIKTMPADDARRALLAAFNLGWQGPPIEDDGT